MFDPSRLQRPDVVQEPEGYPLAEIGEFQIDAPSRVEQVRIAALDAAVRLWAAGIHTRDEVDPLVTAKRLEAWITREANDA